MTKPSPEKKKTATLTEDWISVLLAFLLLLLSVIGVIGEAGLQVRF